MSEARARLFVAVDLPDDVVDALVDWRTPILARDDALRRVPVESLHVTLAFLGSLPASVIPALSEAVERRAAPGAAAGLAIGEPLWLPRRRPRVLTVGVEDRAGALGRLQAGVSDALAAGGWYEPEDRPYLPHVTVARVREGRNPAAAGSAGRGARSARSELPPLPPLAFDGTALTLYRSHLGRGPARYEPLARVPL